MSPEQVTAVSEVINEHLTRSSNLNLAGWRESQLETITALFEYLLVGEGRVFTMMQEHLAFRDALMEKIIEFRSINVASKYSRFIDSMDNLELMINNIEKQYE